MSIFIENRDRQVIPNWRSLAITATTGELGSFKVVEAIPIVSDGNIDRYIQDWQQKRTIVHAGELLSAAFMLEDCNLPEVYDAAKYTLDNVTLASRSQVKIASELFGNEVKEYNYSLLDFQSRNYVHRRIRYLKSLSRVQPRNGLLYVDLARLYSMLGQEAHAQRYMELAHTLLPTDRFVLRSAARLFAHHHDIERSLKVIRKSGVFRQDPWLLASEIAIASLTGRNSNHIKRGIEMINSASISPFSTSELASAIGTIEMNNGKLKASRRAFRQASVHPNDNALAQIKWAEEADKQLGLIPTYKGETNFDFEAETLENLYRENWEAVARYSVDWFLDMPYTKQPVIVGSYAAGFMSDDISSAIGLCRAGLVSHPNDPAISNNLAYFLIQADNIPEAEKALDIVDATKANKSFSACLIATHGLLAYRKGQLEKGRDLYKKAIEITQSFSDKRLNQLATLHFMKEEIRAKNLPTSTFIQLIYSIPESSPSDVLKLKREVLNALNSQSEAE